MTLPNSNPRTHDAVIALDLGGTKLAGALIDAEGRSADRATTPLAGRGGEAVGRVVADELQRLVAAAQARGLSVHAVGACVPGVVHEQSGRVWAPNIAGWDDYPLRDELEAVLDDEQAPVVVESDRAASVLGEAWLGAARGIQNALFVAVGTGIGVGILVDGRVLRGAHGVAGAAGWMALDRPFQPEYAACGCFESRASGDGIAKTAQALLHQNQSYRGPLRDVPSPSAYDVFVAYDQGDEIATAVIDQAVELWGMASANLVSLFNPEMIVFGGGVFGPAIPLIARIAAEARRWAQPVAIEQVRFEASRLGGEAALCGAGYLALNAKRTSGSPAR